tara:strand:+ start:6738 stop:6935 length:198 start_codon:yes stop_codon:yes gene_type:complete
MNYIKRLQAEAETMQHLRNEADEALTEFLVYIGSEKFWNDPTIQVADVQRRLEPLRRALTAMKND